MVFFYRFQNVPDAAIIQIHGFRNNLGGYIVKEFSLISLDGCYEQFVMFEPPFGFKNLNAKARRTALCLEREYHHIPYMYGTVSYAMLPTMFTLVQQTQLYSKGVETCKYLSSLSKKSVYNVEDLIDDCVSMKVLRKNNALKHMCTYHTEKGGLVCARNDAYLLCNQIVTKMREN